MRREYLGEKIRFLSGQEELAAIGEKMEGDTVTITLSGSMSNETAYDLSDELTALVLARKEITIDMEAVTYISPSVLEVLLKTEKRMEAGGSYLRLVRMEQPVYDEFMSRGMHELFEIEVKK